MNLALLSNLAFRNLLRNRRRNLLSSISIIVGVWALIMGNGLVDGLDEVMLRNHESTISGHVLLRPRDYPVDGRNFPLDQIRSIPPDVMTAISANDIKSWAPRLLFRTRLIHEADSLRVKALAYHPTQDSQVFSHKQWKLQGNWPSTPTEIAVGSGLANVLQLQVDNQITLEARTSPGAINAQSYQISAIVNTQNAAIDSLTLWLPLNTAEKLLLTKQQFSHIALSLVAGRPAAQSFVDRFHHPEWTATTATTEIKALLSINQFRRRAISFISFILMAIAATGIANTIMMATYERLAEIGVLRAMGLGKNQVKVLFLLEGTILGLFSSLIGALLGGLANHRLATHGFDISKQTQDMGDLPIPTYLYSHFSMLDICWAILFGTLIALLASIWPAVQAVAINPADAVRNSR